MDAMASSLVDVSHCVASKAGEDTAGCSKQGQCGAMRDGRWTCAESGWMAACDERNLLTLHDDSCLVVGGGGREDE